MKSYKKQFPFKIGTTSFILPVKEDNLVSNVKFLRDSFDVIQLLFFGRAYLDEVMSPRILRDLGAIREESGVSYTVHLPSDLELLDPSPGLLAGSIDVIERIMEETASLGIEVYVLHVDRLVHASPKVEPDKESINLFHGVIEALEERLGSDVKKIFIENTTYDLTSFAFPLMNGHCGVCMDIGHLLLHRHDFWRFVEIFGPKVGQVHLHGVGGGHDHRALSGLDAVSEALIVGFLLDAAPEVILEVYNLVDLVKSAAYLERVLG